MLATPSASYTGDAWCAQPVDFILPLTLTPTLADAWE